MTIWCLQGCIFTNTLGSEVLFYDKMLQNAAMYTVASVMQVTIFFLYCTVHSPEDEAESLTGWKHEGEDPEAEAGVLLSKGWAQCLTQSSFGKIFQLTKLINNKVNAQ